MRPQLKNDRSFKLMFLHSEWFDPTKAAHRMIKYFDSKRVLFGDSKLVKLITLDDLEENDRECVLSGAMRVLPQQDQAGRTIAFMCHSRSKFKTWKNKVRTVR